VSYHTFTPSFTVILDPDYAPQLRVDWAGSWKRSWTHDGELDEDDAEATEAQELVNGGAWGEFPFLPQGTYPLIDLPVLKQLMRSLEQLLRGEGDEAG
jgi:hypothetical protein